MKKYLINPFNAIGVFFLLMFLVIYATNDYSFSKNRNCIVLDKLTTSGGYKSDGRFYLVLKEERDIVFDLVVSPATFSQAKVGDEIVFSVAEERLNYSFINQMIYDAGLGISLYIALCLFIIGFLNAKFS